MSLLTLDEVCMGQIVKRPSKHIKSPYVADVLVDDNEYLAHTPSLGCCGLCESESHVVLTPTPGNKCQYRVQLSKQGKTYVGINPKLSEQITKNILNKNLLANFDIKEFESEVSFRNSRFDFSGVCNDESLFILEVKSVPLKCDKKTAYFPDGYRKKKGDPISPRALKHINELKAIKQKTPDIRCVLCFIIPRNDITQFKINQDDEIYSKAVQDAWMVGVEIIGVCVKWSKNKAKFVRDDIPVLLYDSYGPQLIV
tara:strand:+ start:4080 stop:4844 length:765 start_codon:yes stop_codon:yes gene_type:complete